MSGIIRLSPISLSQSDAVPGITVGHHQQFIRLQSKARHRGGKWPYKKYGPKKQNFDFSRQPHKNLAALVKCAEKVKLDTPVKQKQYRTRINADDTDH